MAVNLPSRPRTMGPRRSIAIVASQYNGAFVDGLVQHARREIEVIAAGTHTPLFEVPGAFEIPLVAQEIAELGNVDAIIALGVIIRGETQHAQLIATAVTSSLQRLSLRHRLPIVHEVLLLDNEEQARARCLDSELNRGTEAARIALQMAQTMAQLRRR